MNNTNNTEQGNKNSTTTVGPLPFIVPGDTKNTFLQPHFANSLIRIVNALWNMTGANGLTIMKSDSNIVLRSPNATTQANINDPTSMLGNTSGSVQNGSVYNCIARYAP